LLSSSQTLLLGSYLFNKNEFISNNVKDISMNLLPYLYTYGFDSKILYEGSYNSNNKIDIMISNHIHTIDFCIYLSILRLFDDRPIYFMFRKNLVLIPGGGFLLDSGKDIKMNRKIEEDYDNINDRINQIKEGIIVIMPEGTRYTPDKLKLAQKYSRENNLTVFNNILYPKMKGLYIISNILKKNNKLGKIIDFTIQVEKINKIQAHMDVLLTKDFGRTYSIINSYDIPNNVVDDYDEFKEWFISSIWKKKDLLLENIQNTEEHNYTELIPQMKNYQYFIIIVFITLFIYLLTHMNGLFIPLSLAISYFITYSNY
jgi:lysophosphatidic acid acyltransferase/lysophosphatidylinositol acyltransferase